MAKESRRASPPTPESILRALKKGEVERLYWVYGAETYLIDRLMGALKEAVLKGSPRGFNFDLFIGKESQATSIIQAARTLPMMAPRRLVLVKDAHDIKAAELELLLPYLASPCGETSLVFVSEKVDKRTRFFQQFQKAGVLVECKPLYERELPGWVLEEAREVGISLSPDAIELLLQIVGSSLGALRSALDKVALFIAPEKKATADDVFAAVADTRARSAFELTAAIGKKDLGAALTILRRLTEHERPSDAAIPLLGTLAWQWRQLIRGSVLKSKGLPKGEVLKELGIFFRQADDYWAALGRFHARELREKHEEIVKADLALKSSPLSGTTILEGLVMRLCS